MASPPGNGNVATTVVKGLSQTPALLAMAVVVGVLMFVFGQRIAGRLDSHSDRVSVRIDQLFQAIDVVKEQTHANNESLKVLGARSLAEQKNREDEHSEILEE